MKQFCSELASEIYLVTLTLYKLMIPTLLVIKLLEEIGLLVYLSWILSPIMSLIGLPESMGVVWATTICDLGTSNCSPTAVWAARRPGCWRLMSPV